MEKRLKEFSRENIIELLEEIDKELEEEITIFMVGGGAMSLRMLKRATMDIDLVVLSKKKYDILKKALTILGYNCFEEAFEKDFYKTPVIVFIRDNRRIDVFVKSVSNQIELSKDMQKRSRKYGKFEKLIVRLVSNEDIFLFKSITDREKDVDDCYSLISSGLDWKVIRQELRQQEKKILWRFWVYEQLCRVRNKFGRLIIPADFFNYIWGLVKEEWNKRPKDFMEGIEDKKFESESK